MTDSDVIQRTLLLPVSEKEAFDTFTRELGTWWPREYTWSRDQLIEIVMEPRQGGRTFEVGPDGVQRDWGRVLAWEEPRRVVFTWQISPTREPIAEVSDASEVEVRFTAESSTKTRMELDHRHFERHGDGAVHYRVAMDAAWPKILERYIAALRKRTTVPDLGSHAQR